MKSLPVAVSLSLAMAVGCGRLSHSEAERLVTESISFKMDKVVVVHEGAQAQRVDNNLFDYAVEIQLEKLGLLQVKAGGYYIDLDRSKLRAEGGFYSGTGTLWVLPIASKSFVRVTGISREGEVALVEYKWKWRPSAFGRYFTVSQFKDARPVTTQEDSQLAKDGVYSFPRRRSLTESDERLLRWLQNPNENSLRHCDALIDENETATSIERFRRYDSGWREEPAH